MADPAEALSDSAVFDPPPPMAPESVLDDSGKAPQKAEPAAGTKPIRAQSADGIIHQFPADTPGEVVDKAMREYAQQHANKTTTGEQMATGFMDPVEGGGQLISELMPESVRGTLDQFNNWMAKNSGGLIRELPPGGKSQQIREREHQIEEKRGIEKGNIDWARGAGDLLNPVNYIGGGLIGGTSKLMNAGRAVLGGVQAASTSPAADPNFWREKSKQMLLGGVFGLGIGGVAAGVSKGLDKVGEMLVRTKADVLENEAVKKIMKRMSQDQKSGSPSATDMIDLVNAAEKPVALVDVAGENTKGLAGNVSRQPGESRNIATQFLTKRDEKAAQRMSADIDNYVHGGQTAYQATEGLLAARSAAARPAYDAAHDLQGVWSPRLQQFLEDPALKSGLSKGYELERLQSLAEGRPISTKQLGVDLDVEGNIKILGTPNMRLLDMAKQGLDAMIAEERNPITGRLMAKGVMLDQVRRAYVKELDNLDTKGLYKKARDTWAGHSASMDAIRLGRSVFGMNPEEMAAEVTKMSPANREFLRMGVADVLKERMAKVGLHGDEAKSIIKNPWMREQLRPAFRSPEEFEKFVDAVTTETRMFETGVKLKGKSPTGERIAEDAGAATEGLLQGGRVVSEFMQGHPVRAAINAWRLYRDLGLRPNPELNEKIAQILFATELPLPLAQKLTGTASLDAANPLSRAATDLSRASVPAASASGITSTRDRQPQ